MQRKLGIVVAMASEAEALFGRSVARACKSQVPQRILLENGDACLVTCAGVGRECAQRAAEQMVSQGVVALASVGGAGGLAPDLDTGDLVVASEILQTEGDASIQTWLTDSMLADRVSARLKMAGMAVMRGRLLTVDQAVSTCDDKTFLFKETGALVVDMESAAVAGVARQASLPFLGLRVVCDPAEMAVPSEMIHCLDQRGYVQMATVLRSLLCRPGLLIEMLPMARTFSRARHVLRQAWRITGAQPLLDTTVPLA